MTKGARVLCHLDEIEDGEGKGFCFGAGERLTEIFVVRDGTSVYGYLNVCPHAGSPLDWQPDRFMNEDGSFIMCHTHGALFRIEDGYCIAGPCAGDGLTRIALDLDEQKRVVLKEEDLLDLVCR
jgi:nitrite reductase/ring-hydroxylating ferredoxin subunit